jgi:hypothetical protein
MDPLLRNQLIVASVIALAIGVGFGANRYLRSRIGIEDEEGPNLAAIIAPVGTLAVILLAFVLALGLGSYGRASAAADNEAVVLNNMFVVANYISEPQRENIQGAMICYGRAVAHDEWRSMSLGKRSSLPDVWRGRFREVFGELNAAKNPLFSNLLSLNQSRLAARRQRLTEANPTIPRAVFVLMTALVAFSLAGTAFAIPRTGRGPKFVALVIVAGFFVAVLSLIRDLDRPFAGAAGVPPTAILETERQINQDFIEAYGANRLPCDDQGRPAA